MIRVDNYTIAEPLINIVYTLQRTLTNGKLKDVVDKGNEIVVTCPCDDHADGHEKNPDMHINLVAQDYVPIGTCHCFGCNASMSFVRFVGECFSNFEYGKQWLIQNYGQLAYTSIQMDDPIVLNKPKSQTKYLDDSILATYQSWHPYLATRKLDRTICDKFKVKYDSEHRQVVFPVYDEHDRLVMMPRRSIDTKYFYMDKAVDKPLYGLNIILKNNVSTCMIVEGPIDLLTCWSNGIPAIATLGMVSDKQIELINKSCIKSLYVATDMDTAGENMAKKIINGVNGNIFTTRVLLPAGRKDVNDLSADEWKNLIKKYFEM